MIEPRLIRREPVKLTHAVGGKRIERPHALVGVRAVPDQGEDQCGEQEEG